MYRIISVTCLLLILICRVSNAEEILSPEISLDLQCYIAFTNFDGTKNAAIAADASLSDLKHREGGAVLVRQTDDYRFWAMTHSMQTLNDITFINSFQVAIERRFDSLFVHALSDTTNTPDKKPKYARVSVVDYQPDSFLENGELVFECTAVR